MSVETMRSFIDSVLDAAVFLKRLNHFWFSELKTCAAKGEELLSHHDHPDLEAFFDEMEYILYGRNQLGDLFVSSPVKRDEFHRLIADLREKYQRLKLQVHS